MARLRTAAIFAMAAAIGLSLALQGLYFLLILFAGGFAFMTALTSQKRKGGYFLWQYSEEPHWKATLHWNEGGKAKECSMVFDTPIEALGYGSRIKRDLDGHGRENVSYALSEVI